MIQNKLIAVLALFFSITHISSTDAKIKKVLPASEKSWETIFEEAKQSVVQVHTYAGSYDIFRPYKAPEHQLCYGSGFFIEDDGYIITNFHVVDSALAVFIQIPSLGKEQFSVEIIGVHPERDLALLKLVDSEHERLKKALKVTKLPSLPFDNSDNLKETQEILLVGYPLGGNIKASLGECSGREFCSKMGTLIQTTVPTNHGNSGGPYLNKYGKIVGVCASKIDSDEVDNIAYFIPINTVSTMLPELYKKIIVTNPFWGCGFIPTTEHTNKYLNGPLDGGIYVTKVYEGSLAEVYGIKKGDILYSVNNVVIDHYGCVKPTLTDDSIELGDYLSKFPLGTDILFTLFREGKKELIMVKSNEPDAFKVAPFYPWLQQPLDYEIIGGLVIVQLTINHLLALAKHFPFTTKYLKAKNRLTNHLIIADILPSSPAHKTRCLSDGDWFIDKINGIHVETIQDFRNAVIAGQYNEYLTIETDEKSLVALSTKEIVQEEDTLIKQFSYPKSELIAALSDAA